MSTNLTVRCATKADIPQLVELMNSQYARKKDEKYFHWMYFDSYYPAISMCAFDGSRLIGMFGMQERKLESGILAAQAIDSLVASDWRKKGITSLLGNEALKYYQNFDILCALPNQHWKAVCEKAFGWKTIGKIDSVALRGGTLKNISQNEMAQDIPAEKEERPARFMYDAGIRAWRFDQRPEYNYSFVNLNAEVFAVTKIFQDPVTGVSYGDIVDFGCDLNNRSLLGQLFLKACEYLISSGVENVTTWALPHTILRNVTESLGFVDMPQERYFCMKVLNSKYEYLYELSNWHLVQADAEIY